MLITKLQGIIDNSRNVVFFGGAGVSTESGLPDFRSVDGLYYQKFKSGAPGEAKLRWGGYPPETMLSRSFFDSHTEEFFAFYKEKLLVPGIRPGKAHKKLAELETTGKLSAVITQNIDGLHSAAGSRNVIELHGSVYRNFCRQCGKSYDVEYVIQSDGVPLCSCGGVIKPDVVLYEEPLNDAAMEAAVSAISAADTLIVGGTSLVVYPAAGLLNYFHGKTLVLINKGQTPYDDRASLVIRAPIGQTLDSITAR